MIQHNKKGFSLIEVLILFTVLAVVLAASVPVISRKSSPVPNKINHGVYRCIHTEDGLIEEIYTGTRRVKPEEGQSAFVEACAFRVPAAALYRIDLYSAGAGGTQAASINAYDDDRRNIDYQITAPHYNNYTYTNSTGAPVGDIPTTEAALLRRLSGPELEFHLEGDNIVRNVYTQDAGEGGTAKFASYNAPTFSECLGHVGATGAAEVIARTKKGEFTRDSDNYSQALKTLDDYIKTHEDEEHRQQKIKQAASANERAYKIYTERMEKLTTFAYALNSFNGTNEDHYEIIRNGCYTDFDQGKGIQTTMANAFSNLEAAVTNKLAGEKADAAIAWATNQVEALYAVYDYEAELQPKIDAAVAAAREAYVADYVAEALKKVDTKDKTEDEANEMLAQAKADAEATANDYFDNNKKDAVVNATKEANPKAVKWQTVPYTTWYQIGKYYSTNNSSQHASAYANDGRSGLKSYIYSSIEDINNKERAAEVATGNYNTYLSTISTSVNSIISSLQSKIDSLDAKQTEESFTEQKNNAKALEDYNRKEKQKNLDQYEKDLEKYVAAYNEALATYHDLLSGSLQDVVMARGYVHDNVYDPAGNTRAQLYNYCAEAYGKREGGSDQLIVNDLPRDQKGAARGVGQYMTVSFPIKFKVPNGVTAENYNHESYLESIEGSANALAPVFCTGKSGTGHCTTSIPNYDLHGKNVGVEEEVKYERDKSNSEMFELKGTDRVFKTTDGEDLKLSEKVTHPYAAWRVPMYTNGTPSSWEYLSNVSTEPTGGGKANMWVEEIDKPTHSYKSYELGTSTSDIATGVIDNVLAYQIRTAESTAAENATFGGPISRNVYDDRAGVATINTLPASESSTSQPLYKDPRIRIHSELWSKEYFAGRSGGRGNTTTFVAASIGSNCTFDVPAPGRVYVPGRDDVIALEQLLTVEMTCFNRDNAEVFHRTLNGGSYNTDDLASVGTFNWRAGRDRFVVPPLHGDQPQWKPTSIWARVVREWMTVGGGTYDLVSRYHVGKGGDGTTIVDRCVVPKGFFTTQTIHFFQTGENLAESQVPAGEPVLRDEGLYTGKIGDQDCYGYPAQNAHFVENYDITARDIYYDVSAERGGGGAVVITW